MVYGGYNTIGAVMSLTIMNAKIVLQIFNANQNIFYPSPSTGAAAKKYKQFSFESKNGLQENGGVPNVNKVTSNSTSNVTSAVGGSIARRSRRTAIVERHSQSQLNPSSNQSNVSS